MAMVWKWHKPQNSHLNTFSTFSAHKTEIRVRGKNTNTKSLLSGLKDCKQRAKKAEMKIKINKQLNWARKVRLLNTIDVCMY